MRSPFLINVTSILRSGEPRHERRAGVLTGLFVSGSEVVEGAEVEVDVELVPVGHAIDAIGAVRTQWRGECRRCLKPVAGGIEGTVRELFEDHPVEGDSYSLVHDEVDLEPLARETVMLELPQAPLCREDCRGLCPDCGVDRNESTCDCAGAVDPRWAVLGELRHDPDERD